MAHVIVHLSDLLTLSNLLWLYDTVNIILSHISIKLNNLNFNDLELCSLVLVLLLLRETEWRSRKISSKKASFAHKNNFTG